MVVVIRNGPRAGGCVYTRARFPWSPTTATSVRGGCNGFMSVYRPICPSRYTRGVRLMAVSHPDLLDEAY